jgi:hypothetical protein
MKPIGFKVVGGYALETRGVFLDLHNDYEFTEYTADLENNLLRLSWQRLSREHLPPNLPQSLRLVVKGAERLRLLPTKDDRESGGARTVSFIGFLHVDQEQVMDGCVDYSEAGEEPDFIVGFEDESALKLFGRNGVLEAELSQGSANEVESRD